MNHSAWTPLFSGRGAVPYEEIVDAIVAESVAHARPNGDWGWPVLHAYLAQTRDAPEHLTRAEALVDEAVAALSSSPVRPTLYGGFTGIGWLSAHTDGFFDRDDDEEAYEEIDQALFDACDPEQTPLVYDLITGIVGLGIYFVERLPSPRAAEGLARVAAVLQHHAETTADGLAWYTHPTLLPDHQRKQAPNGYYNLGVAHGIPGVVGVLAEIHRANVPGVDVRTMLEGSIRWVLKQRLADSTFPSWVMHVPDPSPSRVAWCYGELGLSVSLLIGAQALGDAALEQEVLEIALAASRRRSLHSIRDASLCHGAAGNGHLFNRLFQATRRPEFREAAVFWFERAVEMRAEGVGLAGYRTFLPKPEGPEKGPWINDPSFLTGISGIALALLAAIGPVEPNWDRVLLARLDPSPHEAP
jgi:lantibiotic biosynthesis protein